MEDLLNKLDYRLQRLLLEHKELKQRYKELLKQHQQIHTQNFQLQDNQQTVREQITRIILHLSS